MSRAPIKWAVALVLSGLLHAAAAAVFAPESEPELVEGGHQAELALLGTMFADQVSAGEQGQQVEPVETELTEPATEVSAMAEAAQAVETFPAQTAAEARPAEAAKVAQAESIEAAVAEKVEQIEPTAQAVIAALAPPAESQPAESDQTPAAVPETVAPVEVASLISVPMPSPRPDYVPAAQPRAEKPKAEPERKKATVPPRPKRSGSNGKNQADTRKGTAEGLDTGKSAAQGKRGNSRAGNAAVSNYPGKVSSKLRRALRYPAAAKRDKLRGEVHVAFTVSSSGSVGSVRVVRSSGSPLLDQAAIESVRRAAPFPPIPQDAGRSSWPFTVPLSFTR